MMYELAYLPLAAEDIAYIAEYLLNFYPSTAPKFLNILQERLSSLQQNPNLCEKYVEDPYYRRMVVEKYLVFYHVDNPTKTVQIHRVLRSAWNVQTYLKDSKKY